MTTISIRMQLTAAYAAGIIDSADRYVDYTNPERRYDSNRHSIYSAISLAAVRFGLDRAQWRLLKSQVESVANSLYPNKPSVLLAHDEACAVLLAAAEISGMWTWE